MEDAALVREVRRNKQRYMGVFVGQPLVASGTT
jgi:hypothetical protein